MPYKRKRLPHPSSRSHSEVDFFPYYEKKTSEGNWMKLLKIVIRNIMRYTVMCLSIGTSKIINFPFGTNGKLSFLGVPIFKHIRVFFKWKIEYFRCPNI